MKRFWLLAFFLMSPGLSAEKAKLSVVTTLPVLKNIVEEVGGKWVSVESLADPAQDAHFVQPKPTLMKKVAQADAFVEIGLALELWGQKVVDSSGNPRVQTGQPGRIIAANGIATLEVPQVLSREFGDVHPNGNPHVWLDPINVKRMAANIAAGLSLVDAAHQKEFASNLEAFEKKIDNALFGADLVKAVGSKKLTRLCEQGNLFSYIKTKKLDAKVGGWLKKGQILRGKSVVTYHRTWAYFAARFDFSLAAEIEDKPGIPSSPKHRDDVISLMKAKNVQVILKELFYDRVPAEYIAKQTGAAIVEVPIDVGAVKEAGSYVDMIDYILDRLVATGKFNVQNTSV